MMSRLTPKERRVVELRLTGLSVQEVADHMGIEKRSVTNYVTSIYSKLCISKYSELHGAWLRYQAQESGVE